MVNYDYLYDKEYFEEEFKVEHFVEKELSYTSYEKAYVVPLMESGSGLYTESKEYINASGLHNGWGHPLKEYEVESKNYVDETVIYLGAFYHGWGHIITDVIRKFWFLKSKYFLESFKGCSLVFAPIQENSRLYENARKLFEIMGLDESKLIMLEDIVQFKKVIVPEDCFFSDERGRRYFTSEYRELIQCVRAFQCRNYKYDYSCEKVYYSYASYSKGGGNVGEKKLEKFFEEQGYRIVCPEKYTFEEQLNILANCHEFASTIGSCSHNIIFLPERANAVLIPRAFYLTGYQTALDQVIDLDVHYVDSSLSVLAQRNSPNNGPFYYFVSENLREFFGIDEPCGAEYYSEQLKDLRKYCKYADICDDLDSRYSPEYYNRQFAYCLRQIRDAHPWKKKTLKFIWSAWNYGPLVIKNFIRKVIKNKIIYK